MRYCTGTTFTMSFYSRYSLGKFQLTNHTSTKTSRKVIHRGYEGGDDHNKQSSSGPAAQLHSEDDSFVQDVQIGVEVVTAEHTEPSHHEIEAKSSISGWNKIRKNLLMAFTESNCMVTGQLCITCSAIAEVRCRDCGPGIYYCVQCFCDQHTRSNIFHTAEKWEEDHYVFTRFGQKKFVDGTWHNCSDRMEVSLQCIDEHGQEHTIEFIHCGCEPLAVSLVRARLWPATPHYPKLVFAFPLLEWANCLLLECQVSLKSFCSALNFQGCPLPQEKRNIYRSLINAFEEYRFFKHEIRHLSYLSANLDSGNLCPACSKNEGKTIYALDALFGLPRRKSAGQSFRPPLHGNLCFVDQAEVDEYVADNSSGQKVGQEECNNFLAGNMLRSSTRYHALDETALFGSACRHEFPGIFLNLKHGERLSYAVFMIEALLKRQDKVDMYIMYDVACMLHKHLQVSGSEDILRRAHLCLPGFHSFGHKVSCQIEFGPQRCEGIGLSDGEVMERLWSYLRRFSRMTKEMRPSHRVDVLTHALLHYGSKKKERLGQSLVMRVKRAAAVEQIAREAFSKLTAEFSGGNVSKVMVEQWLELESQMAIKEKPSIIPRWKCEYFELLRSLFELRESLLNKQENSSKLDFYHEIIRLDKQLKTIEAKNKITARWKPMDQEYLELKACFTSDRKQQVLQALWAASSRRQFLLQLKAKYADGQKIAKKLSVQIRKETATIKVLVPQFNSCQASEGTEAEGLLIEEALDPMALASVTQPNSCFSKEKQDIVNAYCRMKRSKEELALLKDEMKHTLEHYLNKQHVLMDVIEEYRLQDSLFGRGAVSLLRVLKLNIGLQLTKCSQLFSTFLNSSEGDHFADDDDNDNDDGDDIDDDDDDDIDDDND